MQQLKQWWENLWWEKNLFCTSSISCCVLPAFLLLLQSLACLFWVKPWRDSGFLIAGGIQSFEWVLNPAIFTLSWLRILIESELCAPTLSSNCQSIMLPPHVLKFLIEEEFCWSGQNFMMKISTVNLQKMLCNMLCQAPQSSVHYINWPYCTFLSHFVFFPINENCFSVPFLKLKWGAVRPLPLVMEFCSIWGQKGAHYKIMNNIMTLY